jgi:hypothetical protein
MPIQSCTSNGKPGKKYGKSGKCYTGSDAKKKAIKQAQAIKASQMVKGTKHGYK